MRRDYDDRTLRCAELRDELDAQAKELTEARGRISAEASDREAQLRGLARDLELGSMRSEDLGGAEMHANVCRS